MPNGGQISCPYCTYFRKNRENTVFGKCDIWGIQCDPFTVCRSFRIPKQSHKEAKQRWKLLDRLEPGIVYFIDNGGGPTTGETKPLYKVVKIEMDLPPEAS